MRFSGSTLLYSAYGRKQLLDRRSKGRLQDVD